MNWINSLPISQEVLTWLVVISTLTFLASLVIIPWLIVRLPADYFVDKKRHTSQLHQHHPGIYVLIRSLKNLFGLVLIAAGVLMLFLPGQGILAMIVGVGLTDFPGKFKLERWFAKQPAVFKAMNWIRQKRNHPPLLDP